MRSLADTFAGQLARLLPGKRSDDPLSSIRAAARWLENLPLGDAYHCQQAIAGALRRLNENSTQCTKDRLAIFMLLDEKSRDLQDALVRQYLRNPRMSRAVEGRLWHAVHGLYWEVAYGYHSLVLAEANRSGQKTHAAPTPQLVLRAIQAFGRLLKWHGVRYLPAGEKLWLRLHQLYRIAETGGFHRQPQRAYPDAPACCCETAYLHALMLSLADSGTLYPRQLDLIDRWLDGWDGMFLLSKALDPNAHVFCVDLSADRGPRRVRRPEPDKPMRFWGTAALQQKLQRTEAALHKGDAPAQLGLGDSARPAESIELLEHLRQHWSALASREQRRAPRVAAKQLVDVTHGLDAIVSQLKTADAPRRVSPYGIGLDASEIDDVQVYGFVTARTRERVSHSGGPTEHESPEVERWVMQDESAYGYGAVVEASDRDWLRVGALIGLKPHDASQWQIGIVRRLTRLGDDTRAVGIETLSEPPVLTMLSELEEAGYTVNGFASASPPHASLWLAGANGADSVIIDPVDFEPGKLMQVHGVAERALFTLGSPLERSEGWMRVTAEPVAG